MYSHVIPDHFSISCNSIGLTSAEETDCRVLCNISYSTAHLTVVWHCTAVLLWLVEWKRWAINRSYAF